jgi:pyruvate dehydrogenase E1 component alpha subunit
VCENNGYAITTSLLASHAQTNITKRAQSYAMPGVSVDGQDVESVYAAASEAVGRARGGGGPTLIEAKTYRFDEHEAGLVVRGKPYRAIEEVERCKTQCDPIVLFRKKLLKNGFREAELESIESEAVAAVQEAIRFAEGSPFPEPSTLYDYMYSNPILYPPKSRLFTV